jgi:hypothetical protein
VQPNHCIKSVGKKPPRLMQAVAMEQIFLPESTLSLQKPDDSRAEAYG